MKGHERNIIYNWDRIVNMSCHKASKVFEITGEGRV